MNFLRTLKRIKVPVKLHYSEYHYKELQVSKLFEILQTVPRPALVFVAWGDGEKRSDESFCAQLHPGTACIDTS